VSFNLRSDTDSGQDCGQTRDRNSTVVGAHSKTEIQREGGQGFFRTLGRRETYMTRVMFKHI
jgi:hypothetical protein